MASVLKSRLSVTPLSEALGAKVTGVDIGKPLTAQLVKEITQAWHDYIVLIFPEQELTQSQQLNFAKEFGDTGTRSRRPEQRPEGANYNDAIMLVTNVKDEKGRYVGSLPDGEMYFHHDMCYMPKPHKGTMLYAIDIPSTGGNTRFSNMYRAYDLIPDKLKKELKDRTALQVYDYHMTQTVDIDGDMTGIHHRSQPIFVRHPETGRTALYVNRLMTARIDGIPRDESDAILEELYIISESASNFYEHTWTEGELAMWDNYCSCHARTDFPANERRLLRRCTLLGQEMIAA